MDLSERKLKILQAIIADFIRTAEPVGSRTLSKNYDLGISPATIRNEMSDLEELGYLTHPHTSSGRVPSEKAYRLYVNQMMNKHELTIEQKSSIAAQLNDNVTELENMVQRAAHVLSEITNLTAFAMTPRKDLDTLKYINLLPVDDYTAVLMLVSESGKVSNKAVRFDKAVSEETLRILAKTMTYNYRGKTLSEALTQDIIEDVQTDAEAMGMLENNIKPSFVKTLEDMLNVNLYMDGLTNIFSLPEYNDLDKARMFLEMVNKKEDFTKTLINRENGVIITIGNENQDELLSDCSVITATYHVNGKQLGKIGVIGPTRMQYDEVTSVIEYLTDNISKAFMITGGDGDDES
ncbi:MAG: heat-inducible transcription repressor HrcA [Firmicutes bacterium]|nr:heat-inducible transcription repressor HrcA [Bacillota bacterium]MBQ3520973.1 heat-inducible transcription repressor HrcA [Bacillota bacterium]MBQ4596564.1 heat-inducible transcription repressor HrcA [Bacillota bacterium]MBR1993065.1 heat-inducible transcription repressor HrcA [Bacillota bacterium]MBR3787137.1 heat-inducible transcription repressor HrcA [Bacillota bacterium]